MSFFWFVPTPFKELLGRGGGEEGRRELSFFSFELRWAARGCACAMCFKRTGRWPTSSSSPRRQPPLPASPPAASASRFPASSLRFPLPRRQPPLPRLERRRLANSLQFPKKKRKRQRTHQHALDARAVDAGRAQVGEHDVVVGAAGDERVAALLEACRVFSPRFFCFFGFRDSEFPLLPLCPFPSSTFSLSFLPTLALLPSARALELASTCL